MDRMTKHNIHVLIHIVHDDGTLATYFLGFAVPDGGDADAYFKVTKTIVEKILPWDEVIALITSLATDGEELNKGHLTGLWTQVSHAKRMSTTAGQPFICVWCVGHRVNLAWKKTTNLDMIREVFTDSAAISTHFHRSSERTRKLEAIASTNNLNKPLRYPEIFGIRWSEFNYNLLKAVLRNWRVSMGYFKSENLNGFSAVS